MSTVLDETRLVWLATLLPLLLAVVAGRVAYDRHHRDRRRGRHTTRHGRTGRTGRRWPPRRTHERSRT